jgi:hypothetical protein
MCCKSMYCLSCRVFHSHKNVLNTGFWWLLKQDQKSIFEYGCSWQLVLRQLSISRSLCVLPRPWFTLMISSNHWILSTVRIPNSWVAFQVGLDAPIRLLLWILLWSQLNLCSNSMCDLRKLSLKKLGSQLQGPWWHLLLRCMIIFIVQELHFSIVFTIVMVLPTFVAALDSKISTSCSDHPICIQVLCCHSIVILVTCKSYDLLHSRVLDWIVGIN